MKNSIGFIRICYWIGFVADLAACIPLLFPKAAEMIFGLSGFIPDSSYLYISRIGASLMLGWTILLLWGSLRPVERRGVLLLTVFPVLAGLVIASISAVFSGLIKIQAMLPLWIFYAIVIPLYIFAYIIAGGVEKKGMLN